MGRHGTWRMVRSLSVWAVVGAVAFAAKAQPGFGPSKVVVDAARLEPVDLVREVTGELRTALRSRLASEEDGLVIMCDAQPGDAVRKDQIIAQLDPVKAELERDRARAEADSRQGIVDQRRALLDRAERDLARYQELDEQSGASKGEMDRAQTEVATFRAQLAVAVADLSAANAAAKDAQRRVDKMSIRAPFAGRVVRKSTDVGEWLQQGDAILEIISLDRMEAWIDVPETLIERLRSEDATVTLRLDALRAPGDIGPFEVRAAVTAIVPDVDPLSRLAPVRLALDNPGGRLSPGMSLVGLVPTGSSEPRLTIHKDAVMRDDAGEFVYIALDGKAVPMRIRSRFGFGDRLVIEPGAVAPGMELIVEGNERLYPTAPVMVVPGAGLPDSPTPGQASAEGDER